MKSKRTHADKELISTFCKLSLEKSISSISVKEICQKADYSKVAFYHHFKDKEDLINRILDQEAKCIIDLNIQNIIDNASLPDISFTTLLHGHLRYILKHILENKDIYRCIFVSDMLADPVSEMAEYISREQRKIITYDFEGNVPSNKWIDYISSQSYILIFHTVRFWIIEDFSIKESDLLSLFDTTISGRLPKIQISDPPVEIVFRFNL